MFTGLVAELGKTVSLVRKAGGAVLKVKAPGLAHSAGLGDSIAINGVCLTIISVSGDTMDFDLSQETLDSTTFGRLEQGQRVNLEPALRADGQLGGHFVTGHVDAVGRIIKKQKEGDTFKLHVEAPPEVMQYMVPKGSVTLDGISLTVVDVMSDSFTLVIIPHTAKVTAIGTKGTGETVNLESDILGKYVLRFLKNTDLQNGPSLMRKLSEGGFMGAGG